MLFAIIGLRKRTPSRHNNEIHDHTTRSCWLIKDVGVQTNLPHLVSRIATSSATDERAIVEGIGSGDLESNAAEPDELYSQHCGY